MSPHVKSPADYLLSVNYVPGTGVPPGTQQTKVCVSRKVVTEGLGQVRTEGKGDEVHGETHSAGYGESGCQDPAPIAWSAETPSCDPFTHC